MRRTDGFWIPKENELNKLGLDDTDSKAFISLCQRYIAEHQRLKEILSDSPDHISPPPANLFKKLEDTPVLPLEKIQEYLSKVVVLKLNGGIGTTMGLDIPRCALPLTGDKTFLDVTVHQLDYINNKFKVDIPLVLMNSIHTNDMVLDLLDAYKMRKVKIHTFLQSCYPRLNSVTWSPAAKKPLAQEGTDNWYPPGSGDVFESFQKSGLLDKFIKEGKEYVFISNMENVGAIVGREEFRVLNEVFATKMDIYLEVTERKATDFRGGVLVHEKDSKKPSVVQISQVPKNKRFFFSPKTFTYWNTNNIWVGLSALKKVLTTGLNLTVSKNIKNDYIQFETYAGSAIHEFEKSIALVVPRTRYREVKTTANLFTLQSNLFTLSEGTYLLPNEIRAAGGFAELPTVRFDTEHFGSIEEYKKRFPSIPNILELEHLNVAGDVYFGYRVKLLGTVIIVAEDGKSIRIPDGAVLENCVISGELVIVDH